MNDAVCPYCRVPVDTATGEGSLCEGCGTPHHHDCYAENGGCTVFGCRCAPAEEPKVAVSAPDLAGVRMATPVYPAYPAYPAYAAQAVAVAQPAVAQYAQPVAAASAQAAVADPLIESAITYVPPMQAKNRMTFTLLGVFLGFVGAHNFYAGYTGKAIGQCCLSVVTLGYGIPMAWIWAVVEICTVNRDSRDIEFSA